MQMNHRPAGALLAALLTASALAGCADSTVSGTPGPAVAPALPPDAATSFGSEPSNPRRVGSIAADYVHYDTPEKLVRDADAVVTVDVLDTEGLWSYMDGADPKDSGSEDLRVPNTRSRARVVDSLSGPLSTGDLIDLTQVGGLVDGVLYTDGESLLLSDAVGRQVLVHIEGPVDEGTWTLLNPSEAVYRVGHSGELTATSDYGLPLTSVRSLQRTVAQVEATSK